MNKELRKIVEDDIELVVQAILEMAEDISIWAFEGDLGAGKTTLIQALAKELQIKDRVSSPTFNYVNEYDERVYHFDCYRLNRPEEALNFGFEEYLDSGKLCWIEWPEVIKPLINSRYLEVKISYEENGGRKYNVSVIQ